VPASVAIGSFESSDTTFATVTVTDTDAVDLRAGRMVG
jgi:hypothetical protein